MILYFIFIRIIGLIFIALGCLFLTRKKIIINRQYDMIFICTFTFGGQALIPFGRNFTDPYGFGGNANPSWTDQYLLIVAAFYVLFVIISLIIVKGKYNIINVKIETIMPVIINLLDEKEIAYEVLEDSVVLTNYGNKKIKCREFLNAIEINFRGIMKLPFYGDVKDDLMSKVKLIKISVFPSTGVFSVIGGIILMIIAQFGANLIR